LLRFAKFCQTMASFSRSLAADKDKDTDKGFDFGFDVGVGIPIFENENGFDSEALSLSFGKGRKDKGKGKSKCKNIGTVSHGAVGLRKKTLIAGKRGEEQVNSKRKATPGRDASPAKLVSVARS
jgi:hypothetical protein